MLEEKRKPEPSDDLSLVIPAPAAASAEASELIVAELESYSEYDQESEFAHQRRIRQAFHMRELRQIDEMLSARKDYATKIYWLMVCWLIGLAVVLIGVGFGHGFFVLDTKIVLALVGGTTLNVLGIFAIVANFLFPRNGPSLVTQRQKALRIKGKGKGKSKEIDATEEGVKALPPAKVVPAMKVEKKTR